MRSIDQAIRAAAEPTTEGKDADVEMAAADDPAASTPSASANDNPTQAGAGTLCAHLPGSISGATNAKCHTQVRGRSVGAEQGHRRVRKTRDDTADGDATVSECITSRVQRAQEVNVARKEETARCVEIRAARARQLNEQTRQRWEVAMAAGAQAAAVVEQWRPDSVTLEVQSQDAPPAHGSQPIGSDGVYGTPLHHDSTDSRAERARRENRVRRAREAFVGAPGT